MLGLSNLVTQILPSVTPSYFSNSYSLVAFHSKHHWCLQGFSKKKKVFFFVSFVSCRARPKSRSCICFLIFSGQNLCFIFFHKAVTLATTSSWVESASRQHNRRHTCSVKTQIWILWATDQFQWVEKHFYLFSEGKLGCNAKCQQRKIKKRRCYFPFSFPIRLHNLMSLPKL